MSNEDLEDKLSRLEDNISEQLSKITHEVDDLYKTVYKGNGVPSLMTRVSSVEDKLRGLREKMDDKISHMASENNMRFDALNQKIESKFGRLEGWIETKFSGIERNLTTLIETKKIDRSGSWQLKAAGITAITALIGTCLIIFKDFF